MLQNNSYLRLNFNDIFINDSFIQETNSQNTDYNFFTYSNIKSINPIENKIEEESILNNNNYSQKNFLRDQDCNKENHKDKIIKTITNREKIFSSKSKDAKVLFLSNKVDNNPQNLGKTEILKIKNNLEKKPHLGRKRKNEDSIGEHNKFSGDNLRRKAKKLIIDNALDFLNEKIKQIYKGNIGQGITIKKLLPINRFTKSDTSIQHNKDILNKTLNDIFSIDIGARYSYYSPNHNKELIKRLLNEKDEKKRIFFKKIFNITFLECLKRFCGNDTCEELKGFKTFNEIKNSFKVEPEYINGLESFLKMFENNIKSKKGRKKRKKIIYDENEIE